MSLSRWLVDYVFIPLGGSRVRQPRVYLNVLITMFLSGLWHGAGLNFLVWGLWHGMLLVGHRAWKNWRAASGSREFATFGTAVLNRLSALLGPTLRIPAGVVLRIRPIGNRPSAAAAMALQDGAPTFMSEAVAEPATTTVLEQVEPQLGMAADTTVRASVGGKIMGWALTFLLVNLGWAFFCMDLPTALFFFRRLFLG